MVLFELVIGLLLGGAVLTALARRIGAPYPVLLALAGTALALAPVDVPGITLDPDLALACSSRRSSSTPPTIRRRATCARTGFRSRASSSSRWR